MDISAIAQLLLCGQSMVLSLFLLASAKLKALALLLLMFAAHMLANVVAGHPDSDALPDITSAFVFAYGPLIYFSIRDITLRADAWRAADLAHGVPFLVGLFAATPGPVFDGLAFASVAAYLAATHRHMVRHRQAAEQQLPEAALADLGWVRRGFGAIVFIVAVDASRVMLAQYIVPISGDLFFVGVLFLVFWVFFWLAISAARYRSGFDGWADQELLLVDTAVTNDAPLSQDERDVAEQAMSTLTVQEFYLKPRLQLADLAQAVGESPKKVSSLLFRHTGERFPQIVNRLRVEAAKTMIRDAANGPCNFLRISYDTGFNSKSSFNLVFKQITGMTPSVYRKSVQDQDSGRL